MMSLEKFIKSNGSVKSFCRWNKHPHVTAFSSYKFSCTDIENRFFQKNRSVHRYQRRQPIANLRKTTELILTHDGSYDAVSRKEVPFGGYKI